MNFSTEVELPLSHVLDDWENVCLAMGPADREAAQEAISDAYRMSSLEAPIHWVWLGSPLSGSIAAAMLTMGMTAKPEIRTLLGFEARDRIWNQTPSAFRERVRAEIGMQVSIRGQQQIWTHIWDTVRIQEDDELWDRVGEQVWAQIGRRMGEDIAPPVAGAINSRISAACWDQVKVQARQAGYGQHDAAWLAFCDFFHRTRRVRGLDQVEPLMRLARAAGWWWPFRGVCIVTERPVALHRDPAGQLHCADGPALLYPDGWAIYAWHGHQVPAWLIEEKARITLSVIEAESSPEMRRVMHEIAGLNRRIAMNGKSAA